jgi:hypothetical protein
VEYFVDDKTENTPQYGLTPRRLSHQRKEQ